MEITTQSNWKRIPKGVSNFEEIVTDNRYYVDKTHYIPLLEESDDFVFFIRPRRFGKSLFISMLQAYYDLANKESFERLFGKLYIGSHPTKERKKFLCSYIAKL